MNSPRHKINTSSLYQQSPELEGIGNSAKNPIISHSQHSFGNVVYSEAEDEDVINTHNDEEDEADMKDTDGAETEHYGFTQVMQQTQDIHDWHSNMGENSALMNMLKGSIGTGLLSMPVVVLRAGLLVGTVGIFAMGLLATYLMHMLVDIANDVEIRYSLDRSTLDYTETVFQVFKHGPRPLRKYKGKIKHTINLFLIITQVGFCCVYILFMTQNVQQLLLFYFPPTNEGRVNLGSRMYELWIGLVITVCLIPFLLVRNLKHFTIPSYLANGATLLGLILIFTYCIMDFQSWTDLPLANSDFSSLLIAFGIVVYAVESISLLLPIRNKMQDPSNFTRPCGVLNTAMVWVVCLYTLLGFFGYLRFGDNTPATITNGIPSHIPWCFPVKPLFIFAVFVTCVLQFYIPASIFSRLLEKFACHADANHQRRRGNDILARLIMIAFIYCISMLVPHLDLMISLVGSLGSATLALVMPPVLDIVHRWNLHRYPEDRRAWLARVAMDCAIIAFGLLGFLGGTAATILQIVRIML